jgi:hypothetical protein
MLGEYFCKYLLHSAVILIVLQNLKHFTQKTWQLFLQEYLTQLLLLFLYHIQLSVRVGLRVEPGLAHPTPYPQIGFADLQQNITHGSQ